MADKYGGTTLPVPVDITTGGFPPEAVAGDPLLGYLANFIAKIIRVHTEAVWHSVSPSTPVIKTVYADEPESGFNVEWLPCLFVFRPGRETRELVETFEQVADEYRFLKSRIVARWIMNPVQQANHRVRNSIFDAIRKAVDAAMNNGRHPSWKVPGDTDPKAVLQGSSFCNFSGAASIELDHAAPGQYRHKMMLPASDKLYDELKMSFVVEELLQRDVNLVSDPNVSVEQRMQSPDQDTGLGVYDLGIGRYE